MPMNEELAQKINTKLDEQQVKIDKILFSVEKTRKYIFWTAVITVAFIVLPLLIIPFAIGPLNKSYSQAFNL